MAGGEGEIVNHLGLRVPFHRFANKMVVLASARDAFFSCGEQAWASASPNLSCTHTRRRRQTGITPWLLFWLLVLSNQPITDMALCCFFGIDFLLVASNLWKSEKESPQRHKPILGWSTHQVSFSMQAVTKHCQWMSIGYVARVWLCS